MLKVIGIGNMLRGDDAIGPSVNEELLKTNDLPVTLIDTGSDAFTILEHLIGNDPLLIIDCAKMGKEPGDICEFNISDANISHVEKTVSLHGFGFGDIYRMAKEMGSVAPCKIIGIEPKTTEFNKQISEDVKKSIPAILKLVKKEAHNA